MSDKFINTIIDTFVTDSGVMIQQLKELQIKPDNDLIYKSVHKLKSSCELFNISEIVKKAVSLEKYISNNKNIDDFLILSELKEIIFLLENAVKDIQNLIKI